MPTSPINADERILAIDIGASSIKFGLVDARGSLVEAVRKIPTPYPCSPPRLIEVLVEQISDFDCLRVGVGFPGEFKDDHVIEPGNLSRRGGISTDIDPTIHHEWQNFNFQRALQDASQREVRIVNDATFAALGYCEGRGRELVFTLGTGFGIALVVDGEVERIRDVGAEVFVMGRTYDELLGEPERSRDENSWNASLSLAVGGFVEEFAADVVHFGGGNARRIARRTLDQLGLRVVINGNDETLRGAFKLFQE